MEHYSIVAISNKGCLIEWVEGTETIASVLKTLMGQNNYSMQHLVGLKKFKDFEKKGEVKQQMLDYQR